MIEEGNLLWLILEPSEFALDDQLRFVGLLHEAYDLRIDAERLGDADDILRLLLRQIDLEAMAHVEDLVHLLPVCAGLFLDGLE